MTTIINASPSNGLVQTADGSGVLKVQSNGKTTNALAWVQFAGASGTIASSYNVSSVTRNSTGYYTVTFSSALSDANYSATTSGSTTASTNATIAFMFTNGSYTATAPTTSGFSLGFINLSASYVDPTYVNIAVFGN